MATPSRQVSCRLEFTVPESVVLALQVAAAGSQRVLAETLDVRLGGEIVPVEEVATAHGGRTHVLRTGAGLLAVQYDATVAGSDVTLGAPQATAVYDDEAILALRQSRYCPSDALEGFAAAEFFDLERGPGLAAAIASWVFERVAYEPGSSRSFDTALETLITNEGVCRDFTHLTIALCRALGVPARFVGVYAPGLSPMDFHAVVEVRVGTEWEVLDPTRLAPRSSLVRIATGRDAADTAFATTLAGDAVLTWSEVSAVVEGNLPADDHRQRIALP